MKTIIVSGALANKPNNGGEALVRLNWVRGFELLGFRVVFLEQIAAPTPEAVDYFTSVTKSYDLDQRSALMSEDGRTIRGMSEADVRAAADSAELLVNISGHLKVADVVRCVRRTAYIDIDPGYTQIWHEQGLAPIAPHDFYFTIGENIGTADCPIPTCGMRWRPTRQPAAWIERDAQRSRRRRRFTTVAAWRGSFGSVEYKGQAYGQKAHEFRKFIELPTRSRHEYEIALQIHPGDAKDRTALEASGWRLNDPAAVAATPAAFMQYVRESTAEFSVAQGIYVQTNSGWFSDRSVRYLAAGRPVLVQDTGFARNFTWYRAITRFATLDQAVANANHVVRQNLRHPFDALKAAEYIFGYQRVLGRLLDEVGVISS